MSFCSSETRVEGKPGDCRASLSHTVSRLKQCLFMENNTSANWSIKLREDCPPIAYTKRQREMRIAVSELFCRWIWDQAKSLRISLRPPTQPATGACHLPAQLGPQEECLHSAATAPSVQHTNVLLKKKTNPKYIDICRLIILYMKPEHKKQGIHKLLSSLSAIKE